MLCEIQSAFEDSCNSAWSSDYGYLHLRGFSQLSFRQRQMLSPIQYKAQIAQTANLGVILLIIFP